MDKYRILQLTRLFFDQQTIHDDLIPYFDQHGRWFGDRRNWEHPVSVIARMRMRTAYLRRSRRTRRRRCGTILRTSYLCEKSTPAVLTYCAVEGNLLIPAKASTHAPNLREIGGWLFSQSNKAIYAPFLQRVGGDFDVTESCSIQAARLRHVKGNVSIFGCELPSLTTVGGSLRARWVFEFTYPKLRIIGGSCETGAATDVTMPLLQSVGGDLLICKAEQAHLPKLELIGGQFLANRAGEIDAPQLTSVGGDINSERAPEFYRHTISCGGDWTMCPGDKDKWLRKWTLITITNEPFSL